MFNNKLIWIAAIIAVIYFMSQNRAENYGNIQIGHMFRHPATLDSRGTYTTNGDIQLNNLYRQIHNLDNIMRIEVMNNTDGAGGDFGSARNRYIAELLDREKSKLKRIIREDIAKRRIPYREKQRSYLGGTLGDCHFGECQFAQDADGKILGIPSVPGVIHPYHQNYGYEDKYVYGHAF